MQDADILRSKISELDSVLNTLLKNTEAYITVLNTDGIVLYINKVAPGVDRASFLGARLYDFLDTKTAEELKYNLNKTLTESRTNRYETIYTDPEGNVRYFKNIMSPVSFDDKVDGVIIISHEQTDIELTKKELETKNSQLKQQYKRLKDISQIIAHDFRAPMANLLMLNELMDATQSMHRIKDYLELQKKTINILEGIFENLVMDASATLSSNDFTEQFFSTTIEKVSHLLQADIMKMKAEITQKCEVPGLRAMVGFLDSILLNLISNALKFSKENEAPRIHVSSKIEGKDLVIRVSDNGRGMDLEKNPNKLFGLHQTFHQLPNERGLGLFLVKNQVLAVGGNIEATSRIGVGTEFKISLPCQLAI
ncbi:PAS domain-containing sensor histidine kinase [Luteibaculum oceani]|uniref:histidine kinase n=1 Tax=Luteibaculum oceani TaxID=1294296 RepID=A0A5C6VBR4_9FLAO|nr:PAS domain-containing sensor histidine kinase [Luteibaculum oceani]TXC82141.1 hypothetical protein FRX97_03340 [Luteibaculum oceani]